MINKSLTILDNLLNTNNQLDMKNLPDAKKQKGRRTTELLKEPEESFTQWYMCIPKCFNDALDIKKTTRVETDNTTKQKKERLTWTQGILFSFKVGDIIYDAPEGYTLPWSEALQKINTVVQITQIADTTRSNQTASKSEVVFNILIPNDTKTGLEIKEQTRATPDNFVRFLIVGPDVLKDKTDAT
jgi:hypothetical protein